VANRATDVPAIAAKLEARQQLATQGPILTNEDRGRLAARAAGDDVILRLLEGYAPLWLAAILGAAVMAAVMASDSQILALSTMFTEDVFAFYGGKARFGERVQVQTGRVFVVVFTLIAYLIALQLPPSIFALASQYSFSGYAAMSPLLVAALFWKNSTKWGALASTLWVAGAIAGVAVLQALVPAPPPGVELPIWSVGGTDIITRGVGGALVLGFLPVVPMTLISAMLMIVVSKCTGGSRPSAATLAKYA
jgi:Na+/proline symporter